MRSTTSKTPAFDSVHMAEASIDALGDMKGPVLKGTAVYIDSQTGNRYGSTTRNVWSPKTLGAMQALLDAMEEDVLAVVFGEDATGGVQEFPIDPTSGVPGL